MEYQEERDKVFQTRSKCNTSSLDKSPQDMGAVITISWGCIWLFFKSMWRAKHPGSLPKHLALKQDFKSWAFVDGASMGPHQLSVERHLPVEGHLVRLFKFVPEYFPFLWKVAKLSFQSMDFLQVKWQRIKTKELRNWISQEKRTKFYLPMYVTWME